MSYILDALKKSEKERQRGQLPNMLTIQEIIAERPRRRFPWAFLIAAALILNAGILIWLAGFSSEEKVLSAGLSEGISSISAGFPEETIQDAGRYKTSPEPAAQEMISIPAETGRFSDRGTTASPGSALIESNRAGHVQEVLKDAKPDNLSSGTGETKSNAVLNPEPGLNKEAILSFSDPSDELAAMDKNRIYRLRELPASVRESLPLFAISALMYSEMPSSRMVRINNEMMHEGQELSAGLKLEEIANDGVIFKYRDAVSFWVGVK
jgi:general secretion pathway protein B